MLIPVIFFCLVTIASGEAATNATPPIPEITSPMFLGLIGVIAIILWVPFFILFRALRDKEKWKDYPLAMPKGSVRVGYRQEKGADSMNLRLKYLIDLRNLRKAQVR